MQLFGNLFGYIELLRAEPPTHVPQSPENIYPEHRESRQGDHGHFMGFVSTAWGNP